MYDLLTDWKNFYSSEIIPYQITIDCLINPVNFIVWRKIFHKTENHSSEIIANFVISLNQKSASKKPLIIKWKIRSLHHVYESVHIFYRISSADNPDSQFIYD